MSEPDKSQTGTTINSQGDTNVGRDVVGRDKYETHQHYQQAPAQGITWEMFNEAGGLAKTLMILGMLLVVGAFLGFIGLAIYTVSLSTSLPLEQSVEQGMAMGPYFFGSIGVAFVGMIITAIGSSMVSYDFYRKRKSSQRQ